MTWTRPMVRRDTAAASMAAGFSCRRDFLSVRYFFTWRRRSTSSMTSQRVELRSCLPCGLFVGVPGIFLSPKRLWDMDLALPTSILGWYVLPLVVLPSPLVSSPSFSKYSNSSPRSTTSFQQLIKSIGRGIKCTIPGGANTFATPATCAANSRVGSNMSAIPFSISLTSMPLLIPSSTSFHRVSVMGRRKAMDLPLPVGAWSNADGLGGLNNLGMAMDWMGVGLSDAG
mmetsp:Transcript_32286/g.58375  ORF Transcript_32286/g.58375 Transcript_32286/m.58375 type:complete len:228 (-) Transcript_32286:182-865(-)